RHFWSWIERFHVTWASIVPTIVAMLLETEKPAFLPGTLRFVRTGSAPLPAADLLAFEARFGIPVIETYGLSEAASQVVANPLPPDVHKLGSAGRPVGVDLLICHPRTDESGELREVAVVGRPDAIYGEQVVAYVAVKGVWSAEMARELHQHTAQRLSPQKVPVDFTALDALPRNPTGKIERRLLHTREQARVAA